MATRSDLSGGISLRFTAAVERARELVARPYAGGRPAPLPHPRRRVRVIGDAQTSLERFVAVLDAHELLGVDGFLADDVQLVSIGDHFDYPPHDGSDPREDGLAILRWLAEHAPAQVTILLGNHDTARVIELAGVSDERFATLRAAAADLAGAPDEQARWAELTDLPTPGLVRRDLAYFTEAQRALVIALLRAGRYRLGAVGVLADGRRALLTHASVTTREVELLGVAAEAKALARALDAHLAAAVASSVAPLDLAPLHLAGAQPHEGGGLLYHRPANPDVVPTDASWDPARRRRYHPRDLPAGLAQICGHSSHRKGKVELAPWVTPAAAAVEHGVLRSLVVDGERITYDVGVVAAPASAAVLYLVDASINEASLEPEQVPLLELAALDS